MNDPYIILSIIFDILPTIAIGYILYALVHINVQERLTRLSKDFVSYQKDKSFKFVLAAIFISFLLKSLALTFYISRPMDDAMDEIFQIFSDMFLFGVMVYFIVSPKYLGIFRKTIQK